MGSNTSKPSEAAVVTKNDADYSDNPDPRSPTPEITRTPLQDKNGAKHSITKNVDLRKTFENTDGSDKLIHNNPILSAVIKNHLQCYDPRSPTQDFERTPIIISSKTDNIYNDKQMVNIQKDDCVTPVLKTDLRDTTGSCEDTYERSPDLIVSRNLCERMINASLEDSIKESEEPLGSSTASHEAIENDISKGVSDKLTTLLETNFDYVENDKFEDSEDSAPNSAITHIDDIKHITVFKLLKEDPRSPSIGIERTPIVVAKIEGNSNECNVENMSDDTLIKVLQNTNTDLRQAIVNKQENCEGLLIYEDDTAKINDTPKKSKSDSVSGSRTPLSCMKNKADVSHARSKSANTLYDPKNQQNGISKVPKRSHIPRLKCLSKQTKLMPTGSSVSLKSISKAAVISGDCENTPPNSHRDRWDKDSSIIL